MKEMDERARRAAQILQNPSKYKVCEGCDSIVALKANTCPNCHGYRFDENPARVADQAGILASRPQGSVKPGDLTD